MYLSILTALLGVASTKPLSSCQSQIECMDIDVTEQDDLDSQDNKQYEICLFWDSSLQQCTKDDKISHACPALNEESKIEGWSQGRDNAMCNIVSCGQSTTFAIKDGSGCKDGAVLANFSLPNYDKLTKCYDGDDGDCGKNSKACRWIIPAPDCEDPPPTSSTSCACDEIDVTSLTVPEKIDTCFSAGCALLSNEGQCECHYCDCAVIDIMVQEEIGVWDDLEDICNACPGCQMNEGCLDIFDVVFLSYVRDRETGLNSVIDYVEEGEDAEEVTDSVWNAVWLIAFGSLIVFVIVIIGLCLFLRKKKSKVKVTMDDIEDESDQEIQVETQNCTR